MTLRFTCRECGHTWTQQTRRNRQTARCSNCGLLALAQGEAAPEETDQPGPSLIRVAASIPTWGTSLMVHLALVLCSLAFAWSVARPTASSDVKTSAVLTRQIKYLTPTSVECKIESDDPMSRKYIEKLQVGMSPEDGLNNGDIIAYKGDISEAGMFGQGGIELIGTKVGFHRGGPVSLFQVPPQGDVVYVVDRSGSMTDSIQVVKAHLKRAIAYLRAGQQFHVIFYSSGQPQEMAGRQLVRATEANKQVAFDFIDGVVPMGQTEPLEAFRRALAMKPQRIIFLTDGEFDKKVADSVRDLNRRVGAQIDTICFIYPIGEELLMRIAAENNGVYKYVAAEDVGL